MVRCRSYRCCKKTQHHGDKQHACICCTVQQQQRVANAGRAPCRSSNINPWACLRHMIQQINQPESAHMPGTLCGYTCAAAHPTMPLSSGTDAPSSVRGTAGCALTEPSLQLAQTDHWHPLSQCSVAHTLTRARRAQDVVGYQQHS